MGNQWPGEEQCLDEYLGLREPGEGSRVAPGQATGGKWECKIEASQVTGNRSCRALGAIYATEHDAGEEP